MFNINLSELSIDEICKYNDSCKKGDSEMSGGKRKKKRKTRKNYVRNNRKTRRR
tara:strand:- start:83 stop:244 length:162 start_codon:yes stop_codon:yes gene_type:complete